MKIIFAIPFALFYCAVMAQSPKQTQKNDTLVLGMTKVAGFGPSGRWTIGISLDSTTNENFKLYPKLKNIPESISDMHRTCFAFNSFQFCYQNYIEGKIDKKTFFEEAVNFKWNLSDTVVLSRLPIRCYVSIVTGYNSKHEPIYLVDADNDNDLANDTIRPLLKTVYPDDIAINSSVSITVTYVDDGRLMTEYFPILITGNSATDIKLTPMQFRYTKVNVSAGNYVICMDGFSYGKPSAVVLPDEPRFTPVGRDKAVPQGKFLNIGNDTFTFVGTSAGGNKIVLTAAQPSDLAPVKRSEFAAKKRRETIRPAAGSSGRSAQAGYIASVIKGQIVNTAIGRPARTISTDGLRGKYVFVDFWSTTCGPCIAEFPNLGAAYKKYPRSKFEIIGVVDERSAGALQRLLILHNVAWPNIKIPAPSTIAKGYEDINSYPTSFLLDPTGKIIAKNIRGDELETRLSLLIK